MSESNEKRRELQRERDTSKAEVVRLRGIVASQADLLEKASRLHCQNPSGWACADEKLDIPEIQLCVVCLIREASTPSAVPPVAAPVDDMALPAGKTCGDCAHWKRCSSLIGDLTGREIRCDFAPSRFKEAPHGDQA